MRTYYFSTILAAKITFKKKQILPVCSNMDFYKNHQQIGENLITDKKKHNQQKTRKKNY